MDWFNGQDPWELYHGDCIPHMHAMPAECVDMAVYSPPFPSVYAYSSAASDLGNSEDLAGESKLHFGFFLKAIKRIVKPGRVMMVHLNQIVRMKRSGGQGVFDFHGMFLRIAERAGFIYDYTWMVRRNPQSQAIRTHSHELQFSGLDRDRAQSRGAMPDFLLKFRAPGENAMPVCDTETIVDEDGELIRTSQKHPKQVSRNEWIDWAECCWTGIKETDTLNVRGTKGEEDTRHICPLQLGTIDRLVRLYSNPGEVVFSPFAGIGSEGYVALQNGRRFYGCELKTEYVRAAEKNLAKAVASREDQSPRLFDMVEVTT
jgi:DNA modification methylase